MLKQVIFTLAIGLVGLSGLAFGSTQIETYSSYDCSGDATGILVIEKTASGLSCYRLYPRGPQRWLGSAKVGSLCVRASSGSASSFCRNDLRVSD